MPSIRRISAVPYNVPLKSALNWGSSHELRQLEHALIRVELSDGAVGIAEATPRPTIYGETQASVLHIVERHLAPQLTGEMVTDRSSVISLNRRLVQIKNNNTAKGALDMALHQALCASRGERLRDYLWASRERLRLSAIVSTGEPAAVHADVESLYRQGLRVFKVKIGRRVQAEIATIADLIESYPDADFYVDANETLDDGDALAILLRLQALGVKYCEEALPVWQLRSRRELRKDCSLPIIADDSAFTLYDLYRELNFETFDILNIKTARTGYSESLLMLNTCRGQRKSAMVGSQASSLLGCLQAAVFAGREAVDCPSECSFYLKTEADLSLAADIENGYMRLAAVEAALQKLQAALARVV